MESTILVNATSRQVRVAILEDGLPVEISVEHRADRGLLGNIYAGKAVRVLSGMQAAFIDVGLERTGFLYVNDALENSDVDPDGEIPTDSRAPLAEIKDVVKAGQPLLVQIQKEPMGTKGARLTRKVSLPDRYLVLLPFSTHIGVSRRIEDDAERERLREAVESLDVNMGFIVRTAAEGVSEEDLRDEGKRLVQQWESISAEFARGGPVRLLHEDLDVPLRVVRDHLGDTTKKVWIDRDADYQRVQKFVERMSPGSSHLIQRYEEEQPLFERFGAESKLERALKRHVRLKSGGTLVFDQAEALTVVDVNSGRHVGKNDIEETVTQVNLEAAREVAYQLRLRNVGGIIIVDFIDMIEPDNRERVLDALREAVAGDKIRTTIVRMSELGTVEMTRKRVRESLHELLLETCPTCNGQGAIKSHRTLAHEALRLLEHALTFRKPSAICLRIHQHVADYLQEEFSKELNSLRTQCSLTMEVHQEDENREKCELRCDP